MFRVAILFFSLLIFYILIALFKSRLWMLVVLIFENAQILAILPLIDSFNYKIYTEYSRYLQMTPGFINFVDRYHFYTQDGYLLSEACQKVSIADSVNNNNFS